MEESLHRKPWRFRRPAHTDHAGRFKLEGMVPNVTFHLSATERTLLTGELRFGICEVKAGEIFDLGDVRTKRQQK